MQSKNQDDYYKKYEEWLSKKPSLSENEES